MLDADALRRELNDLLMRIKPQHLWTGAQDFLEQKAIAKRISLLQNHFERNPDSTRGELK